MMIVISPLQVIGQEPMTCKDSHVWLTSVANVATNLKVQLETAQIDDDVDELRIAATDAIVGFIAIEDAFLLVSLNDCVEREYLAATSVYIKIISHITMLEIGIQLVRPEEEKLKFDGYLAGLIEKRAQLLALSEMYLTTEDLSGLNAYREEVKGS